MPVTRTRKTRRAARSTRTQSRDASLKSRPTLEAEAGNQAINDLINGTLRTEGRPALPGEGFDHAALESTRFMVQSVAARTALVQQFSALIRQRGHGSSSKAAQELEAEQAEREAVPTATVSHDSAPPVPTNPDGTPLDAETRRAMERRLGRGFADVRIFANANAAASARALDAFAFTFGPNIVFAEGQYAPQTRAGSALLAHELMHVKQQTTSARPAVMRKGRTARGFFANLFQAWDYSKETLDEYLNEISRTSHIVGDDDSDDMARQVVDEWKVDKTRYQLTPAIRVLLIREMLDGAVLKSDQEGIMGLLEHSTNDELKAMIGKGADQITIEEIRPEFGVLKDRLELFEREVIFKLKKIKPAPKKGATFREMLESTEAEYGVRLDELSITFDLAAGTLHEAYWGIINIADVDVPDKGVRVAITITRSSLRIDIDPGLTLDIIGPVNPTLKGVKLLFKGVKPKLDMDMLSETGNEIVYELIQDLLAGTRFAAPDYDFTQDPYLIAEIKDQRILGDINRVKYNLQKGSPKESKEEKKKKDKKQEEQLGMISSGGFSISLTLPKGRRFPEKNEDWGLLVPPGARFSLSIEVAGKATELVKRDAELRRVSVGSSGVFVVKGEEKVIQLFGFVFLPGLEFKLGQFKEIKSLKQVAREEGQEEVATGAEAVDWFSDLLGGMHSAGGLNAPQPPPSNILHDLAEWFANWYVSSEARGLVREFWGPIQEYTGLTDKQLEKFFGVSKEEQGPAPAKKKK